MWMTAVCASETASSGSEALFLCTQQMHLGVNSSSSIDNRSNVITSKILIVLSAPAVAKLRPSRLTDTDVTSPSCALNSLTNSMLSATFFQNLTTPSVAVVMRKSVRGVMVTHDSCSLCISDLE